MPRNTVIDFLRQYTAACGRGHSSVPGDLDKSWAVRVWISAALWTRNAWNYWAGMSNWGGTTWTICWICKLSVEFPLLWGSHTTNGKIYNLRCLKLWEDQQILHQFISVYSDLIFQYSEFKWWIEQAHLSTGLTRALSSTAECHQTGFSDLQ